METVNNLANSASKMIFGDKTANSTTESGQEPISGEQGKGTVQEPYDRGNEENLTSNPTSNATSNSTTDPSSNPGESQPASSNHGPHATYAGNMLDPNTANAAYEETFGQGADDRLPKKPLEKSNEPTGLSKNYDGTEDRSSSLDTARRADERSSSFKNSEPSFNSVERVDDRPSSLESTHSSTTDAQDRPTANSSVGPQSTKDTLKSSEPTETPGPNTNSVAAGGPPRPEHETDKTGVVGGMSNDRKASDIRPTEASSNPGAAPESAAAPAQKQQGADKPSDAPTGEEVEGVKKKKEEGEKALKEDPNDHSGEPMHMHEAPKTQTERRDSKAGNPGGQEHGKEEKATGEQWVKTSGLAADGGDFDATKPGAGREADRLMEQKGIHKTAPGEKPQPPSHGGDKDKVGLSEKIKNKLHIGSKDK
ncbi:hypothetical protein AOQ84DRAFT_391649 [Glonium stellatum]|uniref:Uncharacterized protein n=1 Tax=Glonium stellatum TaxID=574774 RepID=A0A8E2ETA5_9PEZI|nr:hypothetical protein AOQ84DRAFT_391649 [Glonium stellatum]